MTSDDNTATSHSIALAVDIEPFLEHMGRCVHAESCLLYWRSTYQQSFSKKHQWLHTSQLQSNLPEVIKHRDFPEIFAELGKGNIIYVASTGKIINALADKPNITFDEDSTGGEVFVPIKLENVLRGFIQLHCPQLQRKNNIINTWHLFGDLATMIGHNLKLSPLHTTTSVAFFSESLGRISQILTKQWLEKTQMLTELVTAMLDIFDADRAWFLFPCDPDKDIASIPVEATRPEFPGAFSQGLTLPMDLPLKNIIRQALASRKPLNFIFSKDSQPAAAIVNFKIQSQMLMAISPALGQSWLIGLHQCSHARIWTDEEQQLFQTISERIGDSLSSQLLLENLQRSESSLQEAQRLARVGSWEWDHLSDHVNCSDELLRIFELASSSTLPVNDFLQRVHSEDLEHIRKITAEFSQTKRLFDFTLRLVLPSGTQKWLLVRGETWYENNKAMRSMGTAQDITEIKLTEQYLRDSEKRLQTVVENMPVMLAAVDKNNVFIAWNREAERITGYSKQEIIGNLQAFELLYPDALYRKQLIEEWTRRGNDFRHWEITIIAKNGCQKTLAWSNISAFVPITDWASWGIAIDITDLKRTEAALIESEKKYRSLVNNLQAGVMVLDANARIIDVNKKACELFDLTGDQLVTQSHWTLLRDDGSAMPLSEFPAFQVRRNKLSITNLTVGIRRPHNEDIIWVIANADPIIDSCGSIQQIVLTFMDITERKRSEAVLRERESFLQMSQQVGRVGSFEYDLNTSRVFWSDEMYRIYDITKQEFNGTYEQSVRFTHPDDIETMKNSVRKGFETGNYSELEYRILQRDGSVRWVAGRGQPIFDSAGHPVRIVGTVQDITERKEAEIRLRQAAIVFENTHEGVVIMDADANILAVNRAFTEITGYTEAEITGKNTDVLRSDRHDPSFYQAVWDTARNFGVWQGEMWNRRKNGELYPEWQSISAVRDKAGRITNYVAVFADISQLKHTQDKLEHLAHHDPLTELPNRLLFRARFEHAVQRASRDHTMIGILFLDLDRFKHINDSLGHSVGDSLLLTVAQQLLGIARRNDTVARLGGDEFIILMEGLKSSSAASQLAEKITRTLSRSFSIQGHELFLSASIGISIYPHDGSDVETLLRNADVAMYQAKEAGRGTYKFYTAEMTARAFNRLMLEGQLRRAVEQNELILHYQPQIDLKSGLISGMEALLRWNHPTHGLMLPTRFIHLAEESGLIVQIGEWVLRNACEQARSWLDCGIDFTRIAVNVAVPQMRHIDFANTVHNILLETNLPPTCLELEITETFLMGHSEYSVNQIKMLRDMGVRLAIDDFGTGYSSLAYLKQLPIDKLKIDRGFIRDLPEDENDAAIARAVIALGHSLQFSIVAEGVETEAQQAFLRREGCDQGQGFLYSQPLCADVAAELMSHYKVTKN